ASGWTCRSRCGRSWSDDFMKLRFSVVVEIDTYPRAMTEKAALARWERTKKRLERAAKGRSKLATVSIV
ncbi:MAG TPA: hypothetical protein VNB29_10920, partial [Chthoniobacterales bacterium]|nr:hypothetical protein [Chthoniobacterales bacterium]